MSPATLRHGAVILAAGGSHRLGVSKQLSRVGAEPLVRRAARAALATHPFRTVVAVGADADATFAAVADLDVERVEVTEWAQGMGASLRAAVQACDGHCDGLLVLLCDQPALTAAHLQRLLAAWRDAPHKAIASAYAGTVGVPAILPCAWFAELAHLSGDRGARELLRGRADQVIPVAEPELTHDVDVPDDLRAARARDAAMEREH